VVTGRSGQTNCCLEMTTKKKISKFFSWVFATLFVLFLVLGSGILDKKFTLIPEEWHGTYSLEKDHPYWTDEFDLSPDQLRCTITEDSLKLLGKKHKISKIRQSRFRSKPRIDLYISSYEKFTLHKLPSGKLVIDNYVNTPNGPDSESWGIAESYSFHETE